jgi:putative ABC transport system ATP-binding protein
MKQDIVIDVDRISKVYATGKTEVHALRGVDFAVERGEMIAIMGASGSGKSTLMNILGCLDYPTDGTYELDGVPGVQPFGPYQCCRQRGVAVAVRSQREEIGHPQARCRGTGTRGPRRPDGARAERTVRRSATAGSDRASVGDQTIDLARRRAYRQPGSILLADEPTGNLDSRTSIDVLALFQELNTQGITILLVTHEPDIATYTSRIVELRDGRIIRDEAAYDRRAARLDLQHLEEVEPVG